MKLRNAITVGNSEDPQYRDGCEFKEDMTGPRCGEAVTQVICWIDGRFSPACSKHGLDALEPEAVAFVRYIFTEEPCKE